MSIEEVGTRFKEAVEKMVGEVELLERRSSHQNNRAPLGSQGPQAICQFPDCMHQLAEHNAVEPRGRCLKDECPCMMYCGTW